MGIVWYLVFSLGGHCSNFDGYIQAGLAEPPFCLQHHVGLESPSCFNRHLQVAALVRLLGPSTSIRSSPLDPAKQHTLYHSHLVLAEAASGCLACGLLWRSPASRSTYSIKIRSAFSGVPRPGPGRC